MLRDLRASGDLRLARALVELRFRQSRQIVARAVSRGALPSRTAVAPDLLEARSKRLEQVGRCRLFALGSTMDLLARSLDANNLARRVPYVSLYFFGWKSAAKLSISCSAMASSSFETAAFRGLSSSSGRISSAKYIC